MHFAGFGHDLVWAGRIFSNIILMQRNGILTNASIWITKHNHSFSG
jgi:hypothetical protein